MINVCGKSKKPMDQVVNLMRDAAIHSTNTTEVKKP